MKYKLSGEMRKDSHVLITISIGQENQTKESFEEMISVLIENKSVGKITLLKADTLQRHRLEISRNINANDAEKLSKEMSAAWEIDNAIALGKLKQRYDLDILTWDNFKGTSEFEVNLKEIEKKYDNDKEFRKTIVKLIQHFKELEKSSIKKGYLNLSENIEDSLSENYKKYILEECSVFISLIKDPRNFKYEVYNGERNKPIESIYKIYAHHGNMVALKFIKNVKNKTNTNFFTKDENEKMIHYEIEVFPDTKKVVVIETKSKNKFTLDKKKSNELIEILYLANEKEESNEEENNKESPQYNNKVSF